jgi:hypothetical protein
VGSHNVLNSVQTNLTTYFGAKVGGISGGTFADVIGFHGYVGTKSSSYPCPNPEEVNTVVNGLNTAVSSNPLQAAGKPWFNTEGGWSKAGDEGFTDPDQQSAFLARYFLLQRSLGVDRVYWYRWDATQSVSYALWDAPNGPVSEAGNADGEVNAWLVGATVSSACTANQSVWSCGLTRPGGYKALAVWDAAQTCTKGVCTTSNFTVPSGYTEYLDLTGKSTSVSSGATVAIGAKPILLENGSLP